MKNSLKLEFNQSFVQTVNELDSELLFSITEEFILRQKAIEFLTTLNLMQKKEVLQDIEANKKFEIALRAMNSENIFALLNGYLTKDQAITTLLSLYKELRLEIYENIR